MTNTWEHDEIVHGYWVEPGQLLAGEYPGDRSAAKAEAKIGVLLDAGVRTFVDLTRPQDRLDPYEPVLARVAASKGVEVTHLSHPVPDMGIVHDDAYDAILAAIEGAADGVVYVHCWGGIGRTATVVGCWLVNQGHEADAALARIDELRSVTRKAHMPAPQTDAQIDVIRRRRPAS